MKILIFFQKSKKILSKNSAVKDAHMTAGNECFAVKYMS